MADRLPVGRVHGHRGRDGEMTVRVGSGEASRWSGIRKVWLRLKDGDPRCFEVEQDRAYRDRWVLKLAGIDDANDAAGWRGAAVTVDSESAPALEEFEHWRATLVGMKVIAGQETIGAVKDVQPTGATDLLIVETNEGDEVMVPMHRDIVVEVNEKAGELKIDPPEGLLELNREVD